jgi:hypothetical protein
LTHFGAAGGYEVEVETADGFDSTLVGMSKRAAFRTVEAFFRAGLVNAGVRLGVLGILGGPDGVLDDPGAGKAEWDGTLLSDEVLRMVGVSICRGRSVCGRPAIYTAVGELLV